MEGFSSNPEGLTPEEVDRLQKRVRDIPMEEFLSRTEEVWPDGKGKTITWPDSDLEVRVSFEDPDTAEEESYGG